MEKRNAQDHTVERKARDAHTPLNMGLTMRKRTKLKEARKLSLRMERGKQAPELSYASVLSCGIHDSSTAEKHFSADCPLKRQTWEAVC